MAWYRRPRTLSEMRAVADVVTDSVMIEFKIRPRRSMPNIPTTYDDISIRPQRSWKVQRMTQYKLQMTQYKLQMEVSHA